MSWYLAIVVRGTFMDDALHEERLADRLFRLIEASDAEAAYQKALGLIESSACDETYTDDDGTAAEIRAMGLADLREIDAPEMKDGVEVYAEVLPGKPSQRIVTDKEQLTVFEPQEIPEGGEEEGEGVEAAGTSDGDVEASADPRFSDGTPIR